MAIKPSKEELIYWYVVSDLSGPFFPGAAELWHHQALAYSAELPGAALQHAALVHPALHPQVPVRSYLWLGEEKPEEAHVSPLAQGLLPYSTVTEAPNTNTLRSGSRRLIRSLSRGWKHTNVGTPCSVFPTSAAQWAYRRQTTGSRRFNSMRLH